MFICIRFETVSVIIPFVSARELLVARKLPGYSCALFGPSPLVETNSPGVSHSFAMGNILLHTMRLVYGFYHILCIVLVWLRR